MVGDKRAVAVDGGLRHSRVSRRRMFNFRQRGHAGPNSYSAPLGHPNMLCSRLRYLKVAILFKYYMCPQPSLPLSLSLLCVPFSGQSSPFPFSVLGFARLGFRQNASTSSISGQQRPEIRPRVEPRSWASWARTGEHSRRVIPHSRDLQRPSRSSWRSRSPSIDSDSQYWLSRH